MAELRLRGDPASPGTAVGPARVLAAPAEGADGGPVPEADREAEATAARRALVTAAGQLELLASGLRAEGREDDAAIVETGALMAADPMLLASVNSAVRDGGRRAPAALVQATDEFAEAIARLDDEMLAARADDVRSLGRRASRLAAGGEEGEPGGEPGFVLVATELGPADVAELAEGAAAIALARGGVRAHAAIVARSLGIPMVVGVGDGLLAARQGSTLVVDGDAGSVVMDPDPVLVERTSTATALRVRSRERLLAERELPSVTRDGRRVRVLANVAGAAEVRAALAAGAEGVGLLRTELAFLDAPEWPRERAHRAALDPVLGAVGRRTATVRVLDFGGDKTPPFLTGTPERGIALLLAEPAALEAQLRAILAAEGETSLRIMLPMVGDAGEVRAVRDLLQAAAGPDAEPPPLGAMIETPEAAARAEEIAAESDFLSIGTNDLAHSTLASDRFAPGEAPVNDPRVLRAIARTVAGAGSADIPLEVCGEAASDPLLVPILVGLGVDELSVGAARVAAVRAWIRALDHAECRVLAEQALALEDAAAVAALGGRLARSLELLESGDGVGEGAQGSGSVVALGPQP